MASDFFCQRVNSLIFVKKNCQIINGSPLQLYGALQAAGPWDFPGMSVFFLKVGRFFL